MISHDQKGHVASHSNHLNVRNAVVLLTMPSALCDANAGNNGVTSPKSHVTPHLDCHNVRNAVAPLMTLLTSDYQKSLVAPHFNHLNLKNEMVPLMMLSASYADNASMI